MKGSLGTAIVIIILSLATWVFFYCKTQPPLTFSETSVVVGAWVVIVLCGKWLWKRLQKKEGKS